MRAFNGNRKPRYHNLAWAMKVFKWVSSRSCLGTATAITLHHIGKSSVRLKLSHTVYPPSQKVQMIHKEVHLIDMLRKGFKSLIYSIGLVGRDWYLLRIWGITPFRLNVKSGWNKQMAHIKLLKHSLDTLLRLYQIIEAPLRLMNNMSKECFSSITWLTLLQVVLARGTLTSAKMAASSHARFGRKDSHASTVHLSLTTDNTRPHRDFDRNIQPGHEDSVVRKDLSGFTEWLLCFMPLVMSGYHVYSSRARRSAATVLPLLPLYCSIARRDGNVPLVATSWALSSRKWRLSVHRARYKSFWIEEAVCIPI